jgi:hypothetical protein
VNEAVGTEVLRAAIDLTEEMLSVARHQEWSRVVELDQQRRPLIQAFFGRPVPPASAEEIAGLTRRLRGLNDELISFSEQSRGALSQALAELGRGRRAQAAYGQPGKQ